MNISIKTIMIKPDGEVFVSVDDKNFVRFGGKVIRPEAKSHISEYFDFLCELFNVRSTKSKD